MALTDTDRRRLMAATALTLLALPALWWANTSENSVAPNLAVAGIDADVDVAPIDQESPAGDPAAESDDVAPVFLDGPSSAAGAGLSEIAVPQRPLIDDIMAKATFRSSVRGNTCIVTGVSSGSRVTVVNLANNRTFSCTSVLIPDNPPGTVVLPTAAFAEIADLTDAPISVEIRR